MRIAICDDNNLQLNNLKSYTQDYCELNNKPCVIDTYGSAEAFLFEYEEKKDIDILILDIQMKELNGIELAKKLRTQDSNVAIIFATAISDYAFEGYSVKAVDYILKPIKKDKLFQALDRAVETLNKTEPYIILEVKGEYRKTNLNDIYYIESSGRNCIVNFDNYSFDINKGISYIENMIKEKSFFKCHRSYLVNIEHISSIQKTDILLENNAVIPIARGKWEELNKAFLQYYRRNLCSL